MGKTLIVTYKDNTPDLVISNATRKKIEKTIQVERRNRGQKIDQIKIQEEPNG